jgi:hypothetical protein
VTYEPKEAGDNPNIPPLAPEVSFWEMPDPVHEKLKRFFRRIFKR